MFAANELPLCSRTHLQRCDRYILKSIYLITRLVQKIIVFPEVTKLGSNFTKHVMFRLFF